MASLPNITLPSVPNTLITSTVSVDDPSRFANRFRVRSSRLANWDYSSPGIYFITICTYGHNKFFGKIVDNQVVYSPCGQIAHDEIITTIKIRQNIKLDPWMIMPNHVHLLISIPDPHVGNNCRDVARYVSTDPSTEKTNHIFSKKTNKNQFNKKFFSQISPQSNSISSIIRSYKSAVKKRSKELRLFFSWQPRFYDEIVTTKTRLFQIRNYIINNPKNWGKDKFFVE